MNIRFEVHGMPACKGSWRPVRNKHTGKTFMKADDASESAWSDQVAWGARAALRNNCQPDARRYAVRLEFGLLPPPNRRKTNRRDVDKMCRSILDALTGLIWIDDEQVDVVHMSKIVTDSPGVVITIESIDGGRIAPPWPSDFDRRDVSARVRNALTMCGWPAAAGDQATIDAIIESVRGG